MRSSPNRVPGVGDTRAPRLIPWRSGRIGPPRDPIYAVLKADEAMHLDEVIEKLEAQLSSSEIFAAMFELELAGKVKQLPGKNFVRSF